MDRRGVLATLLGIFCLVFGAPRPSEAEDMVRIVVPFAAGGTNDLFARFLADRLRSRLGRTVVVDNRPGAGGQLATKNVIASQPDGNTLLISTPSVIIQSLRDDPPFDVTRDLAPVIMYYSGAHTLYVNPSLPVHSVEELIAYAKSHRGDVLYASFGVGSQVHLAFELLNARTDAGLIHVPYRSNAETLLSVTKNEAQMSLEPYMTLKEHVETGAVRPLAVTSLDRDPNAPDLPTISEAGVPGFNIIYWSGIHVPRGTPPQTIKSYNQLVNDILKEPEAIDLLARLGVRSRGGSAESFADYLNQEIATFGGIIRERKIKF
jgi:tripartite-type tricarboxylate transporter receptor subunit TctC